jgi:undecaprenyl-diphosphatase
MLALGSMALRIAEMAQEQTNDVGAALAPSGVESVGNRGLRQAAEMTEARRPISPVVALAVLLPVTLALTLAAAGPGILPGDVTTAHWLQALPLPSAGRIAWLGYLLGGGAFVIGVNLLLVLVLWWGGWPRLAAVALGILGLRLLNPLLKLLAASPRPTLDLVLVTEQAPGYGFPSGHTMSATLVYGGIIWLAEQAIARVWLRRTVQVLAALAIVITVFGRVYTGAHWPSDVLGGVLWGLIELVLLVLVAARILPRYLPERRSKATGVPIRSEA